MNSKVLQLQHLNAQMLTYSSLISAAAPKTGWVHAIRTSLGMSLQQLGAKMSMTKQSIHDIEKREMEGSITLKSLREVANALDMKLVYGLVPIDGSLDTLIERKSKSLAEKIVRRTSNSMKLEDQENSAKRLEKAIRERAAIIKQERPKILWD